MIPTNAALVSAAVGLLAWFAPDVVGGGDPITLRTLVGAGRGAPAVELVEWTNLLACAIVRARIFAVDLRATIT